MKCATELPWLPVAPKTAMMGLAMVGGVEVRCVGCMLVVDLVAVGDCRVVIFDEPMS